MTTKLPARLAKKDLTPSAAVRGAYDLKLTPEAVEKLKEIEEAAAYAVEQASVAAAVSIVDDASQAVGAELIVNLTKVRKVLEELQKFFTSPLEANKKKVIATMKALGEAALKQEDRLRNEAASLWTKKENERIEAERKRLAEQQAAEQRARALGRSPPKPLAPPPVAEPERVTRTENGSVGITLEWAATVTEPNQVPKRYWVIDQKLIDADVRAGVREIPGVLIQQRPKTAVR